MLTDIVKKLNENQPEIVHWFVGEVRVWYDYLTPEFIQKAIMEDNKLAKSTLCTKQGWKEYKKKAILPRFFPGILPGLRKAITNVKEIEICYYKGPFAIQRKRKDYPPLQQDTPRDDSYLRLYPYGSSLKEGLFYVIKSEERNRYHASNDCIDLSPTMDWKVKAKNIIGRQNGITGLTPRLNVEIANLKLYVPLIYEIK